MAMSELMPTSSTSAEEPAGNPLEGHIRYEKVEDLGKGSQGFVMLANDRFTGERVAIKFLPRGIAGIAKIKRELLNHRRFWHAHVIQFYEVFLTERFVCIVMEYAPGGSLAHYLSNNVLTEDGARFYFQQLIFAVRYCHHMGVANRDIKLENTLLDSEQKLLKLCDFGLSKEDTSLCRTRVGTPNYLAPEIITMPHGGTYDGKLSDVWCCGVMLYAMICRSFPFEKPEDRNLPKNEAMKNLMERIVNALWSVAPGVNISESCKELLSAIFQPDTKKRITIQGIIDHPWYRINLPEGADDVNYPERPNDGLQTMTSIIEIVTAAAAIEDEDVVC